MSLDDVLLVNVHVGHWLGSCNGYAGAEGTSDIVKCGIIGASVGMRLVRSTAR